MKPYYQDDAVTIYHGDCREVACDADVVISDPPYGVGKKYGDASTDSATDADGHALYLIGLGKPLAMFWSSTRLWSLPKPQWLGVWHKPLTLGYWSTPLIPHWEPILFYGVPTMRRSDVFTCNPERAALIGHPTPKPLRLMGELVRTMPLGVILDPFMGSGTTLRAAKDLGRKAIGIEIEERYCEIAAKRMQQEVLAFG